MNDKPPFKPVAPFYWVHKPASRKIRDCLDGENTVCTGLAVYGALCEIASDVECATFRATHAYIMGKCGVKLATVKRRLKDLREIGLVDIQTENLKTPSTYTLSLPKDKTPIVPSEPTIAHQEPTIAHGPNHRPRATLEEHKEERIEERQKNLTAPETAAADSTLPGMAEAIAAPDGAAEVGKKSSRSAKKATRGKGHPDHARVIQEFSAAYQEKFGCAYVVQGGKDGAAVSRLLKGATADEIIQVATAAWDLPDRATFLRQQAATLAGLAGKWNEVRAEVNNSGGQTRKGQSNGIDF